jgi:hypothetical protein
MAAAGTSSPLHAVAVVDRFCRSERSRDFVGISRRLASSHRSSHRSQTSTSEHGFCCSLPGKRVFAMTVHQSRRAVLAFATLVVTSITIGAPVPLTAHPLHPPIANHVLRSYAQVHETHKAIAPRSRAAPFGDNVADPFASIHLE